MTAPLVIALCGFSPQTDLTSQAEAQRRGKKEEGAVGRGVKEADIPRLKQALAPGWSHLEI